MSNPNKNARPSYLVGPDGKDLQLSAPVCLGEVSIPALDASSAGNDLASLIAGAVSGGTAQLGTNTTLAALITAGLNLIKATVETNDIRVSFFDQDPATYGGLFKKDTTKPHDFDPADFTKLRMAAATATAKVTLQFFA